MGKEQSPVSSVIGIESTRESYTASAKIYQTDPFEYREFFEETFLVEERKNMQVLVLGCGPADDVAYIQEQGFSVVGIDNSSGMIEEARKRHPEVTVVEMDMLNAGLLDEEQWDIVCLPYSLFHVPKEHLSRTLGGISRIVKPHGYIYLTTQESMTGYPEIQTSKREDDAGDLYINAETEQTLTEELVKAGFVVTYSKYRSPNAEEHQFNKRTMVAQKRGVI